MKRLQYERSEQTDWKFIGNAIKMGIYGPLERSCIQVIQAAEDEQLLVKNVSLYIMNICLQVTCRLQRAQKARNWRKFEKRPEGRQLTCG